MKNYLTIIVGLSLYTLSLIPTNEYKQLCTNSDDRFEVLTPDKYRIAIEYPRPDLKEISQDVKYSALGVLDPEEIEEVTVEGKTKCCPGAYSDPNYNKTRGIISIVSGGIALTQGLIKTLLMYEGYCGSNDPCAPCVKSHSCKEEWWSCGPSGNENICIPMTTGFFVLSTLGTFYAWMPWHTKDHNCNCCKKERRKVFRIKNNNNDNI